MSGIPVDVRRENEPYLWKAVLAATLGGAPRAVAGFEGLVGFAAFEVMNLALWAKFFDGDISFLKKMVLSASLWRGVVAGKYKDYCKGKVTGTGAQQKDDLDLDGTILR